MVPFHFSNELKPNSGDATSGIRISAAKIRSRAPNRRMNELFRDHRVAKDLPSKGFAINKARKPGANVRRLVKMARHALRMTADRKGKPAQTGHRGEH